MARNGSPSARCAAALLLLFSLSADPLRAAPERPSDDAEILERLPAGTRQDDQPLHDGPGDLDLALSRARRYAALGRDQADPRFYGYARAALAPWWSREAPPIEVRVLRAVLLQADHDFEAALADLSAVLAVEPAHAQARLTQAMILRARGRPAEARASCEALSPRVPRLIRTTCLGATASLTGAATASYDRLNSVLEAAWRPADDLRVWALSVLGEIARQLGRDAVAERHFRDGLALGYRNSYLLGALADLLLDQGRNDEVRALLAHEQHADALLLRLTEAELKLGAPGAEAHRATLAARFEAGRRRGEGRHAREEARFALRVQNRRAAALRLAQENWRQQREPADVRLLLEAALAADVPAAAQPALDWLRATGLESHRIDTLKKELGS